MGLLCLLFCIHVVVVAHNVNTVVVNVVAVVVVNFGTDVHFIADDYNDVVVIVVVVAAMVMFY